MEHDYSLIEVTSETLEELRSIRNECRLYMTGNQRYIDQQSQLNWFKNVPDNMNIYLLCNKDTNIGYAILKCENDRAILTGGLVDQHRNKGIGKILFSMLIEKSYEMGLVPRLDVLKNNERAIRLYQSLGFEVIDQKDDIYIMEI